LRCLSVREHIFGNTCPTSTIWCACYLWPWLGPLLAALRYVMYFCFYDVHYICTKWAMWRHVDYRYCWSEWRHCVVVRRLTLSCCVLLVASYPRRRRAPRLDESMVQGVPAAGGGACNAPLPSLPVSSVVSYSPTDYSRSQSSTHSATARTSKKLNYRPLYTYTGNLTLELTR